MPKFAVSIIKMSARLPNTVLELILEVGWLTEADMKSEYDECGQLLALFSTIAKNC
jgi:hypothetical protein